MSLDADLAISDSFVLTLIRQIFTLAPRPASEIRWQLCLLSQGGAPKRFGVIMSSALSMLRHAALTAKARRMCDINKVLYASRIEVQTV